MPASTPTPGQELTAIDFENFFEHSLCGFLVAAPSGFILKSNKKMALWSGYTDAEMRTKKFPDLLSIGGKIYYETHLNPLLRIQGSFDEVLLEIKTAEGQKFRALVNAREQRDANGLLVHIQFIVIKASDRLQYEQNLQQSAQLVKNELSDQKEDVALREQLIAVLGHDLRNPLAAIGMATELLKHSDNVQDTNVINILKRSGHRMRELVEHIMDFARVKLGDGIGIVLKDILLLPVLQQVTGELELVHDTRKIVKDFKIEEPVHCDAGRIGQLVSNLLANAITHGAPDQPIYINAFNNASGLQIDVINSGEPIPESMRQKLFAPFTREQSKPAQHGLGLGLYICAEIAKAHNGTLICISDMKETRFTFSMPRMKLSN